MRLPPSPALSACDSLDGIEDLDAYLEQQGNLSHFPTPPLNAKKTPFVEVHEVPENLTDDGLESVDYDHIALVLTEEASLDVAPVPSDIEKVLAILISADLPLVVVALAFNILSGLHSREAYIGRFTDCPPDLLVATALSLAVTCTYDSPPTSNFWAKRICRGTWTKASIEKAIMKVLASLDFRLHEFSLPARLEQAVAALSPSSEIHEQEAEESQPSTPEKEPLRLVINGSHHLWINGQMTPEQTPPCDSAFPAGGLQSNRFLPLL